MEARPVPEEIFYSTQLAQLEDFPGKGSALVIPKFSTPPPKKNVTCLFIYCEVSDLRKAC